MSSHDPYVLEVKNLKKTYGKKSFWFDRRIVHAVQGVSFTMRKGITLGLVGESGCGKSTLGKMIVRLEKPDFGQVLFEGKDLWRMEGKSLREQRKEVQLVFQDPYSSLNPRMTIGKILEEPFVIHKLYSKEERKIKISELLREVGLNPKDSEKYPQAFSGGQRQRIGIARALSLRPKLVVCDEPVSALDVSVQSQILNLMMDLKESYGLTFLFISHDLSVVEYISDYIAVMYLGSIVEFGPTQEVLNHPRHPYTQSLIDSIPKMEFGVKRKIQMKGEQKPLDPLHKGCPFYDRCPKAHKKCLLENPIQENISLEESHQVYCHEA